MQSVRWWLSAEWEWFNQFIQCGFLQLPQMFIQCGKPLISLICYVKDHDVQIMFIIILIVKILRFAQN